MVGFTCLGSIPSRRPIADRRSPRPADRLRARSHWLWVPPVVNAADDHADPQVLPRLTWLASGLDAQRADPTSRRGPQGAENARYVTDDFLTSIAKAAGLEDINRWNRDRRLSRWDALLAKTESDAQRYGFGGTPSFLAPGPEGAQPITGVASPGKLLAAINRAG